MYFLRYSLLLSFRFIYLESSDGGRASYKVVEINENFFYLLYKAVPLLECNCNHCSNVVKHLCAVDTYFPRFSFSRKKNINTKLNVLLHSTAVHNNLKWKRKEKEVSTKNCNFAFIIYAMLYIKFIKTTAINIQTTVAAAEWTDSELQFQLMEKNAKENCFEENGKCTENEMKWNFELMGIPLCW